MRKPEQRVWDTMRKAAPFDFWLERVENLVGDGMPDVHVGAPAGGIRWVELKAAEVPKRATTRLLGNDGLRQSQINWHLKAASMRLPVWTVIRTDTMQLYMISAYYAATINDMTCDELQTVNVARTWAEVFEVLK